MSYFVFSIFVKNEKSNLETHISIFRATLKRKNEILGIKIQFSIYFEVVFQAAVFLNFLNF